jgi:hypothetical protein
MIRLAEGTATLGDLYGGPQGAPGSTGAPDGWRSFDTPPMATIQDERGKQVGAQQAAPQRDVPGEVPVRRASRQEFLFTALRWDFREAQIMVQGYLDGNPAASDADAYKHCLQHARAGRHWNQSEVPSNLADALDADPTRAPDGSRARRLQEALGKDSEAAVWCARAILHLHPGLDLGLVYETSVQLAQEVRNWTARGAKDMRLTDLVACIQRESDWDPSCATLGHDGVWYRGLIQCPSGELGEGLAEIGGNLCHWGRERSYASYCGGPGNPQWWYSSQVLGLGAGIEKALRAEDAAARKKAEKGSA